MENLWTYFPTSFKNTRAPTFRNQKGFGLLLLISFLPIGLTCLCLFGASRQIMFKIEETRYLCRSELIQTMKQASTPLQILISLNPVSETLKQAHTLAVTQLKLAIVTGNQAAILIWGQRVTQLLRERQKLDRVQRKLYSQAETALIWGHQLLIRKLQKTNSPEMRLSMIPNITAEPAVIPSSGDIAPIWKFKTNFEAEQKQAQTWQLEYLLPKPFRNWIRGRFQFPLFCAATLTVKENKWIAILKEDRS